MSKIVDRRMTAGERKELKGVISREFSMIGKELAARQRKLEDEAEERVREVYADKVEQAKAAHEVLKAEAAAFEERAKLLEEQYREQGIAPTDNYGSRRPAVRLSVADEWAPIGMKEAIRKARDDVRQQALDAKLALDRREHDFQKRLAATGIVTGEANEFFGSLPETTDILPRDMAITAARTAVLDVTTKGDDEDEDYE